LNRQPAEKAIPTWILIKLIPRLKVLVAVVQGKFFHPPALSPALEKIVLTRNLGPAHENPLLFILLLINDGSLLKVCALALIL
jgi:hypothetical protein